MATNGIFRQPGSIISVKASKALTYHELIAVGDMYAVTKASADKDTYVACDSEGVFKFPKATGAAIIQGSKVYLGTDGTMTATAGDTAAVGIAWTDESADATTVDVKINA